MPADRKIVICDRCGERFDYIPETCSKCGEILAARMDPDARRKIESLLYPKSRLKIYLFVIYAFFMSVIVFTGFRLEHTIQNLAAFILYFSYWGLPLAFAIILTAAKPAEKQKISLHGIFIAYNFVVAFFAAFDLWWKHVLPFYDFSGITLIALQFLLIIVLPLSLLLGAIIAIRREYKKGNLEPLWLINIWMMMIFISVWLIVGIYVTVFVGLGSSGIE